MGRSQNYRYPFASFLRAPSLALCAFRILRKTWWDVESSLMSRRQMRPSLFGLWLYLACCFVRYMLQLGPHIFRTFFGCMGWSMIPWDLNWDPFCLREKITTIKRKTIPKLNLHPSEFAKRDRWLLCRFFEARTVVDLANCTLVAFSDQLLLIGFQDLGFTCVYM